MWGHTIVPSLPTARSPQYRHKICIKQRPLYVPAAKPSTLTVRRMAVRSRWFASFCKYRRLPIPTNKSTMTHCVSPRNMRLSVSAREWQNRQDWWLASLFLPPNPGGGIPNSRSSMSALSSFCAVWSFHIPFALAVRWGISSWGLLADWNFLFHSNEEKTKRTTYMLHTGHPWWNTTSTSGCMNPCEPSILWI